MDVLSQVQAFPLVFYLNGTLTLLYYVGAMQFVIRVIGSFLSFVLRSQPIEAMSVAGGIFMEGVRHDIFRKERSGISEFLMCRGGVGGREGGGGYSHAPFFHFVKHVLFEKEMIESCESTIFCHTTHRPTTIFGIKRHATSIMLCQI